MIFVPDTIVCVDCGQTAHRLGEPPGEGWAPGDYVAYRCSGCNDRWDLTVSGDGEDGEGALPPAAGIRELLEARCAAGRTKSGTDRYTA